MTKVTAFGHNFLEVPGLAEDLITLEREGAVYGHFCDEDFTTFHFYKIRLLPSEIFQFVEAHLAKQKFDAAVRGGATFDEALRAIGNDEIAERVRSYGNYGRTETRDGEIIDIRGCAASFYPPEMEELLCGLRRDRYEMLPNLEGPDKTAIVIRMIDSFPISARYLAARQHHRPPYQIENEYDVQDLMYAIMRSIFEDARTEEWTPKHAGVSKRIDVVVPSIATVIEVKYVRDRAHARTVADELKVDIESYHSHPNCQTLLALVYDPHGHIVDPAPIANDLSGLRVKGSKSFEVKVLVRR